MSFLYRAALGLLANPLWAVALAAILIMLFAVLRQMREETRANAHEEIRTEVPFRITARNAVVVSVLVLALGGIIAVLPVKAPVLPQNQKAAQDGEEQQASKDKSGTSSTNQQQATAARQQDNAKDETRIRKPANLTKEDVGTNSKTRPTGVTIDSGANVSSGSPQVPQTVDHGILNSAPNLGVQKVEDNRKYGDRQPAPPISEIHLAPIIPPPGERALGRTRDTDSYEILNDKMANPGIRIALRMSGPFANPAFIVTCDTPCVPTGIFVHEKAGISSYDCEPSNFRNDENDPRIVLFLLESIQTLSPDETVFLTVRSMDSTVLRAASVESYVQ